MEDPIPQFAHIVSTLKTRFPSLAYLHVVEPNVHGDKTHHGAKTTDSNNFIRTIWAPKRLITAGGYSRDLVSQLAEEYPNEMFAFGKYFLSNVRLHFEFVEIWVTDELSGI